MTASQPDVLFIRGTGRCGTTMLLELLGRHPQLAAVPRDEVLPEQLLRWSDRVLDADETERRAAERAAVAYFERFCLETTGRSGGWVHKATMQADMTARLLELWPQAKLVYLVRHPVGVVASMINADIHRFNGRFGYEATVANSALRWHNDLAWYLRSGLRDHERVFEVRYEALVADPVATLAAIHRFAGVEPIPAMPPRGRERYARPFVLNERERRWIVQETAPLTARLGYGDPRAAAPANGAEPDDHVDRRLRFAPPSLDGVVLLRAALAAARQSGWRRVGLFGAGYAARLICPHLTDPLLHPVCLLDEDRHLAGTKIGSLPVHHPEQATPLELDGAIAITFVHQQRLMARWGRLVDDRLPIAPLWDEGGAEHRAVPSSTHHLAGA